jgi:hypothetical protein
MTRLLRHSLIGAAVLVLPAYATPATGTLISIARLLTVFFVLHFVLLLGVSLFWNLKWRLTPPPGFSSGYSSAGGPVLENRAAW